MSTQPWSPLISMAFMCSPAERYISTAALGSLISLAQSACFFISIFVSLGSPDPRNSCNSAIQKCALPSGHKHHHSLNSKTDKGFCNEYRCLPRTEILQEEQHGLSQPSAAHQQGPVEEWEETMASLPSRQFSSEKTKQEIVARPREGQCRCLRGNTDVPSCSLPSLVLWI